MSEVLSVEEMKARLGQEIGVTDWIQVNQDRIDNFAECTGDHQWIHVNKDMAEKGPFGKTIAHGYLTLSLIPKFSEEHTIAPTGTMMAVNYGLNKLRLLNPVTEGSKVRDRISMTTVEEKTGGRILVGTTHTIEIDGQEKPALVAETLTMFFTQP